MTLLYMIGTASVTKENDNNADGTARPLTADTGSSPPVNSTPEQGLEMMGAFCRIRDLAVRKALIKIASDLADRARD